MIVANLVKRNLRLFFRDKMSVFFSLLSVFIIIGLYVLFLGDMMTGNMGGLGGNVRFLNDAWIMAGLLAVTTLTTTLGAFGIMVEDSSKKIAKDFSTAPLRRSSLVLGYILSAFAIGMIMSALALVLSQIYIIAYGGRMLGAGALLKTLGLMALSVLASSSMAFLLVSFFKSNNAFSTASTIVGTLIGFLTGVYIPVGVLPEAVQYAVKVFPVAHSGLLFRRVFMEAPLQEVFAHAPTAALQDFRLQMGVDFAFGGHVVSSWVSILVLIGTAVLFFALGTYNISRKSK